MISAFIEIKGYLRKKVKEFSYFAFCLKKTGSITGTVHACLSRLNHNLSNCFMTGRPPGTQKRF